MLTQPQIYALRSVPLAILLKVGFARTLVLILFLLMPLENNAYLYVHLTTMPILLHDSAVKIANHIINILLIKLAKLHVLLPLI